MKIYFIQQGSDGPIKIGVSWDVRKRFEALKVYSPVEPKLLTVIVGNREKEKKLHREFKKEHMQGEWFKPSSRLMKFIQKLIDKNLPKLPKMELKVYQPVMMDGEELLTPFKLSEFLSTKPDLVLSWARRGKIPHIKMDERVYFKESEIEEWFEKSGSSQNPPQAEKVVQLIP